MFMWQKWLEAVQHVLHVRHCCHRPSGTSLTTRGHRGPFSIPTLSRTIRSQRVGILLVVSKAMRKGFFIRNQGRQEARLWKGHPNGNQAKNSDALLELLHGENCSSGFYGEMAQL